MSEEAASTGMGEGAGEAAEAPEPAAGAETQADLGAGQGGGESAEQQALEEVEEEILSADDPGDLATKKFRLTIDGKEKLVPGSEVLRLAQIGRAAFDRFEDTAKKQRELQQHEQKLQQQVQQLQRVLMEDPLSVIEKIGAMPRLEEALIERLQMEQLPEDQRRLREVESREKRLAEQERRWKQQQEEAKKAAQEKQYEQAAEVYRERINKEYVQALDSVGFPKSETARRRAIARMADMGIEALEAGIPVPTEMIAQRVAEEFRELATGYVSDLDPSSAEQVLGQDWLRKLRNHDVSRLKDPMTAGSQSRSSGKAQAARQKKEPVMFDGIADFSKLLDS